MCIRDRFTARQVYLSAVTVQATLHERDQYIQLSRLASLTMISDGMDQAVNKLKSQTQKTLDKLVRNDIGVFVAEKAAYSANAFQNLQIDGGTLNSTGIAARFWTRRADGFPMYHNKTRIAQSATVVGVAASGMTTRTLQHAAKVLRGNDVEMINGTYKAIMHPDVAYQLTTNAGFKGWFAPTTAEPVKGTSAELGVIAGVRILQSTQAHKFNLSGDTLSTASGNAYASLVFGDEAYGVSEIAGVGGREGFSFFIKASGSQSTNDPTNMIRQVGSSITAVARVLNKSAGLWVWTTGL
jgi:N4-gp56 family major capsid protein